MGDELNPNPAVVISNHASLADCFVLQHLSRLSTKSERDCKDGFPHNRDLKLPIINFFSWFLIWRVPSFKILTHLLKTDENWELEESSILYVFAKLLKSKFCEWIVLFPEVNVWTLDGYNLQQQIGEKYFLPKLEHLLYPRYSAFHNIITAMTKFKPHPYSNLYDLTILYCRRQHGDEVNYQPPTLLEIFSSKDPITVLVYVKVRSIARIPNKRKKLERYLEHLWKHKDKIMTQIKEENNLHQMRNFNRHTTFTSSISGVVI